MPLVASSKLARRAAYSLAAGAVANLAPAAHATIVYSGIEDLAIAQRKFQKLQLDGDGMEDIRLSNYVDPYVGFTGNFQGAFVNFSPGRMVAKRVGNLNYAKALGAGFLVDDSNVNYFTAALAGGANNPNAEFNTAENAYIGFRFSHFPDPEDPFTRLPRFGWVRVSINNAAGTFVIRDWAYESEFGVGIVTGDMGDAGDFNDDGRVDAADYTVWRDNLGTHHILAGHGDENGDSFDVVDNDDYTIWKANFGHVSSTGTAASLAAPEPGTLGLLAAGALGVMSLRRRRG
jgi:hypothetical protein